MLIKFIWNVFCPACYIFLELKCKVITDEYHFVNRNLYGQYNAMFVSWYYHRLLILVGCDNLNAVIWPDKWFYFGYPLLNVKNQYSLHILVKLFVEVIVTLKTSINSLMPNLLWWKHCVINTVACTWDHNYECVGY